jgi:hypothetical protein
MNTLSGPSEPRSGGSIRKETQMRRVIVKEWLTLDGLVQAPSYADEDRTGGFQRGGWHTPLFR